MTDLTEQWKKGELPCGWYYIKIADIVFIDFFEGKVWKNKKNKYIDEVLAPLPSYKEWKKAYECVVSENEEITTLKELLKDLRDKAGGALQAIQKDCESDDFSIFIYPEVQYFYDLLTKINQTLGGDK